MNVSFDEIRRMAFRALDAARAPEGVDEDSAINAAWMEASGLPGLKLLCDALDGAAPDERHGSAEPRLEGEAAFVDAGGTSAVFLGPGLMDLMKCLHATCGETASLEVAGLRHGEFLIGFIGQEREDGHAFVLSPAAPPPDATDVRLSCGTSDAMPDWSRLAARRRVSRDRGIDVDETEFGRVHDRSRKILVPETERSRLSGAGAGLTDND